jgi:hypothetical protein
MLELGFRAARRDCGHDPLCRDRNDALRLSLDDAAAAVEHVRDVVPRLNGNDD